MRYVNREGRPIGEATWKELYRDPAYATGPVIDVGDPPTHKVEISWVGCILSMEAVAMPFCVRVLAKDKDGSFRVDGETQWFPTEPSAINGAKLLAMKLKGQRV